jgi:hypothetical protein
MNQKEFESEMGRAKVMKSTDGGREDFWMGYTRGLRRGYHGEKFGTDEEHQLWWNVIDDNDESRAMRGQGYWAGIRCARLGREYCSQNDFCCEICSLVNYGLDCHNNPI